MTSEPVHILEILEQCADLIKVAGFELQHVSRHSEARYFNWPGRRPVLRLATHRRKKPPEGLPPIVARLTIGSRHCDPYEHVTIDRDKIPGMVASVIGRYMLVSAPGWVHKPSMQGHFTLGRKAEGESNEPG